MKAIPIYTDWLASSIRQYEKLAKDLIGRAHKPEKGRIVEAIVKSSLRTILPGRFSIGTGFAVTSSGKTSSQLDIVIYDAWLNAPLILEGGIGLFPIECIYGFVEVKSKLDRNAINSAADAIRTIRSFAKEKKYLSIGVKQVGKNQVAFAEEVTSVLSPRSFVFAVNTSYGSTQAIQTQLNKSGPAAHVHGLAVLEKEWFIHQRPDFLEGAKESRYVVMQQNALRCFCAAMLGTLQSMPIKAGSMKAYLGAG